MELRTGLIAFNQLPFVKESLDSKAQPLLAVAARFGVSLLSAV